MSLQIINEGAQWILILTAFGGILLQSKINADLIAILKLMAKEISFLNENKQNRYDPD